MIRYIGFPHVSILYYLHVLHAEAFGTRRLYNVLLHRAKQEKLQKHTDLQPIMEVQMGCMLVDRMVDRVLGRH